MNYNGNDDGSGLLWGQAARGNPMQGLPPALLQLIQRLMAAHAAGGQPMTNTGSVMPRTVDYGPGHGGYGQTRTVDGDPGAAVAQGFAGPTEPAGHPTGDAGLVPLPDPRAHPPAGHTPALSAKIAMLQHLLQSVGHGHSISRMRTPWTQ